MKRAYTISIFLTVFLLALSIQSAYAQFGIRAGINFATFNNAIDDLDSRTGLLIGAYYDINIPVIPLSIQPEVTYNQKGAAEGGAEVQVDYIEVPVLAKLSFAPGPVSPHIYAGPYVGFVLDSKVSSNGVSLDVDNAETDFGGIVGAGIDINAGVTSINLGARYGFGLIDAFEGGQGKNGVFSIVGGIAL